MSIGSGSGDYAVAVSAVSSQISLVCGDINRMQGIIDDAANELLSSFSCIQAELLARDAGWASTPVGGAIRRAITALQFQDMAGQLMSGARARLETATDVLDHALKKEGDVTLSGDDAPRPDPAAGFIFPRQVVQQHSVAAGEIELF
jgi:hypothetical protein